MSQTALVIIGFLIICKQINNKLKKKFFSCICAAGFTGQNCSINIDDCHHNKCKNSALCIDGINTYECKCPLGYSGQYCDVYTELPLRSHRDIYHINESLEFQANKKCSLDNCEHVNFFK